MVLNKQQINWAESNNHQKQKIKNPNSLSVSKRKLIQNTYSTTITVSSDSLQ